jgi:hypothetical protein
MSVILDAVKAALKSELGAVAWGDIDRAARKVVRAMRESPPAGSVDFGEAWAIAFSDALHEPSQPRGLAAAIVALGDQHEEDHVEAHAVR